MFESISIQALDNVSGGCGCSVHQGQTPDNFNTGITGGMNVPNNKVPPPLGTAKRDPGFNTGITGGLKGINNKVPRPR